MKKFQLEKMMRISKHLFLSLLIFILLISGCTYYRRSKPSQKYKEDYMNETYYKKPRVVELKLTYHLQGIKPADGKTVTLYEFSEEPVIWKTDKVSTSPVCLLYIGRQQEYPNQRYFDYYSIEPEPDKIISRDPDGNQIEFYDLSEEIKSGKDITITRHLRFTAYETSFPIKSEWVGLYDTDTINYRYYTRTQEFMEQTPEVVKLAESIVGDEKNPYYKARLLYDWTMKNINYVYPPNRGILYDLPRKTGDCGSYSMIYVTLCRAVGIPARIVNGHWCCKEKKNYHVWTEIMLPVYGWIPVDPTDGRINLDSPGTLPGNGDPYYYFGNLDSGRFITSKGTSIPLYPSPPWHIWGLSDTNRNPIFFQSAAVVYSNIEIEKKYMDMEIIKGDVKLW